MKTIQSTLKFFRTWCKSRDIEFVSSSRVVVPHAVFDRTVGRKIIYMPLISAINFDEWQRQGYHESSHLAPQNLWHYDVMHELSKHKGVMLHDIANCLVDNIAERVDFHEYRGRAEALSTGRAGYAKDLGKIMRKNTNDPKHLMTCALLKWDALNRERWMINFVFPPAHEPMPHLDEFYNKMVDIKLDYIIDYIAEQESTSDLVELVLEIDSWIPSQNGNNQQQGGNNGEEGGQETAEAGDGAASGSSDGAEGAASGGSEGTGEDGGSPRDTGKGEGAEAGGAAGKDNEPGNEGVPEQRGHASEPSGHSELTPTPTGQAPTSDTSNGSTFEPRDEGANITEVQYTQEELEALTAYTQDVNRDLGDDMTPNDSETIRKLREKGVRGAYLPCTEQRLIKIEKGDSYRDERKRAILRQSERSTLDRQVRKHLQLRSTGRTVHGVKRGRLSSKNLHRLYNGGSQIQPAVFKRNEHGKVQTDSAVSMLIDMSGSMGNAAAATKYTLAAASALSFAEVLNGLRIKHEILGFTHSPGQNILYLLKEFKEKPLSKIVLAEKLSSSRIYQDHNADGEALQTTAERLMKMSEKNKVLMVLSDGLPNGYWKGDGKAYLRLVVDDIENHSPIHLCAIGIMIDSVSEYYTNYQVIDNIDKLANAVLETLKSNLLTM